MEIAPACRAAPRALALPPLKPTLHGPRRCLLASLTVLNVVPTLPKQGRIYPETAVAWFVLGCHVVGGTVYATHWPQRQYPRTFDRCGFSHNIMHVLCFAAYVVAAYPYLEALHAGREEWWALLGTAQGTAV
jgi:hypothetical protein